MSRETPQRGAGRWRLPQIGQRMIKTAAAVFICLLIYYHLGYQGGTMPTEAAITAIICMQPYIRDAREYALNRMTGTLIGAFWGLVLLAFLVLIPLPLDHYYTLYALMALGVLASLYTSVALHKPDASSLAAIVFICVVIAFPDIEEPLVQAVKRVAGVMVGTAVAVGVNVVRLPRSKNTRQVFFLRSDDLIPDRYAQISPSVLFRLNSLCMEGAKICLISRHAPAFFTAQMNAVTLNLPMIVMDGAALYDTREDRYLLKECIRQTDADRFLDRLSHLGWSCFIYTIHRNRTCIFHRGDLRAEEREVLNRLRRSPYRSYLKEEIYNPDEIVCFKIIGRADEIAQLEKNLHTFVRGRRLRSSIQDQTGIPGVSGLYIYAKHATVRHAENRLMELLRLEHPDLEHRELFLPHGYRSEHDAMLLLYQLLNQFAPIRFLPAWLRRRK